MPQESSRLFHLLLQLNVPIQERLPRLRRVPADGDAHHRTEHRRAPRLLEQRHAGFFRRARRLLAVARLARADDVLPAALAALEKIAPQINEILWVTEIRAIAADDLWMSPHYQRDCIGIHFTWKKVDAVYEFVKVVEAVLAPFNYRPHMGKVYSASPEYIRSVMPKMSDFVRLVKEIDPMNKFGNAMTDNLLGR